MCIKSATKHRLKLLILLLSLSNLLSAAQDIPTSQGLRVGLAGSEPFIIHKDSATTGISFEIWKEIANEQNLNYRTQNYNTVREALAALEEGKIDLVVGSLSITADRIKRFDFSQPYYFSGQSIMSRKDELSIWNRIEPFFSEQLLVAVLIFLFILATVGTLFWLVERHHSPDQFSTNPLEGIGTGMWLAVVTMSTVGYGDKAPVSFWGRVLAGCWIVISIIFATSMMAGISSTLTLTGMGTSTITEIGQLRGKKVAAPALDVSKPLLENANAKIVETNTIGQSFDFLLNKKVDAIVFDRPQLLYLQQMKNNDEVIVGLSVYEPTGFGFAFPVNSPMVKKVNISLLNLTESGKIKEIKTKWIGADRKQE